MWSVWWTIYHVYVFLFCFNLFICVIDCNQKYLLFENDMNKKEYYDLCHVFATCKVKFPSYLTMQYWNQCFIDPLYKVTNSAGTNYKT